MKVVVSVDLGIDDALALVALEQLARCGQVEILGICTTFGNTSVENATNNVLALSEQAGWTTPVFVGSAGPLKQKRLDFPTQIHGEYGFGQDHRNTSIAPAQIRPALQQFNH
jgi:purine nucleosidase